MLWLFWAVVSPHLGSVDVSMSCSPRESAIGTPASYSSGGLTWNNTNGVHSPMDLSLNKGSIRWTENVIPNIQDLPMDQRWACKGQILSSRTGPATLRKPTEGVQA